MITQEMQRSVAQWMLDNYTLFTELLNIAIFVHRQRSYLNWNCTYGHGEMSLDGQLKFNMHSPIGGDGDILVFTFELWCHNGIRISHVDHDDSDDEVFGGSLVFELLGEEDFIHFEKYDMSDVPKAHKLIKERLHEFSGG